MTKKLIEEKKLNAYRKIHYEFIPTKEKLFDLCERLDNDIKEIRQEIEFLNYINESLVGYSESQVDLINYLKKNIYAMKLTLSNIDKRPEMFGELANFDKKLLNKNEFGSNTKISTDVNNTEQNIINLLNNNLNPDRNSHQFEENFTNITPIPPKMVNSAFATSEKEFEMQHNTFETQTPIEDLSNYEVTNEEIRDHFYPLFFSKNESSSFKKLCLRKNTIKTIQTIKNMKKKQSKMKLMMGLKKSGKSGLGGRISKRLEKI